MEKMSGSGARKALALAESSTGARFWRTEAFRALVRTALGAAALVLSANLTIPMEPVPFTLQVLALCFIALALKPAEAASSAGAYVFLGALGAPVFSGGLGGVARLAGPTGGFIFGFIAAAALGSWLLSRISRTRLPWIVSALVSLVPAIASVYLLGWAQLMFVAHLDAAAAFAAGVAPFIVFDLMKAGLAATATAAGRIARKAAKSR